jgi:hypothetical protein
MPTKPATRPILSVRDAKFALAKLQDLSIEQLNARLIERRAFEAVVWGMPAVNFQLMAQAIEAAGARFNQIVYWSRPFGWKNQTLTPNPDVIYLMPFYDTKDGPIVIEVPAAEGGSITGSIDDAWQTALEDVGPAGVDKGKGGKYLILPPGFNGKAPDGYIALQSATRRGFAILRSNLQSSSDADIAKAVEYGRRVKIWPLSQADNPSGTKFTDLINTIFDSTIAYDVRFFEALDRFVQQEPWLTRDKAMIDMLKSIGIEKGKSFNPDADTRAILNRAAAEAHAWLDAKYESVFTPAYYPASRWALPALKNVVEAFANGFSDPDDYPIDGRGSTYSMAFFSAKHLGTGQFYLMAIKDRDGEALDGAKSYRLRVPANPPVTLYWSATAYDRITHALIRGQSRASRASTTAGVQKNTDGSTDLFFGPKAPAGKESNWVPTSSGGKYEVLFRFYGPEKPLFDKTWVLPDIEKAS